MVECLSCAMNHAEYEVYKTEQNVGLPSTGSPSSWGERPGSALSLGSGATSRWFRQPLKDQYDFAKRKREERRVQGGSLAICAQMRVSPLGRADHAEWRWRAKDERWDWRGRLGPERRAKRAWPKSLDFTLWAMRKSLGVLSRGRWCDQIYIFARWFQLLGGECTGKGSSRTASRYIAKIEVTGLGAHQG